MSTYEPFYTKYRVQKANIQSKKQKKELNNQISGTNKKKSKQIYKV
jgi:hypothetical protein